MVLNPRKSKLRMASKSLELPEDVEVQILSWLPVKSLMRFKSVCKSWYAVISDPAFVAKHLANSMRNPCLLLKSCSVLKENETGNNSNVFSFSLLSFRDGNGQNSSTDKYVVDDVSIPLPTDLESVFFVGHCDGIICLSDYDGIVLLWNPTTHECKLLPDTPYQPHTMGLNQQLVSTLGFGYDAKSGDYKVVRVSYCGEDVYDDLRLVIHPPRVDVYTSGSDSWRQILEIGSLQTETTFVWPSEFQMCFKGTCYWLGNEQLKEIEIVYDQSEEEFIRDVIISLDMENEVFRTILLPDSLYNPNHVPNVNPNVGSWERRLVPWDETIALYAMHSPSFSFGDEGLCFEIWVMDDLGGGKGCWTKHLTFGSTFKNATTPILEVWNKYEIILDGLEGQYVSYNVGTKELEYLPVHNLLPDYYYWTWKTLNLGGVVCVSSLVSVMGRRYNKCWN